MIINQKIGFTHPSNPTEPPSNEIEPPAVGGENNQKQLKNIQHPRKNPHSTYPQKSSHFAHSTP